MSLQKKTALPSSVKLEMTPKQLDMMVYMLGAIDLRTDPATLEIAMDLRKKLQSAMKQVQRPKERPTDKFGKHLTDKEIEEKEKAQAVAAQAKS
jgi:hypothetical protein